MSKIVYFNNGIGYIDEEKLPKCGCGGKAVADFHCVNDKQIFCDVEICCRKCGISTGICKTADEAIMKWMNAFKIIGDLKGRLKIYEDDICLSCSKNFLE